MKINASVLVEVQQCLPRQLDGCRCSTIVDDALDI